MNKTTNDEAIADQSLRSLSRAAIRLHFHINCASSRVNDMATNIKPTIKYTQQANNCKSGPWNVLRGTKSPLPKPIVDNVTKQKYALSTKLQFSHIENITVPMQM